MNKSVIAMFALGAVAFAGSANAEKLKATLDGKSEVPPNPRRRPGDGRSRLRGGQQEAVLARHLSRPARARHGGAFPRASRGRQERRRCRPDPERRLEPCQGRSDPHGRAGRRSARRQILYQHPHRSEPGRRDPRPGDEVTSGPLVFGSRAGRLRSPDERRDIRGRTINSGRLPKVASLIRAPDHPVTLKPRSAPA